MGRKYNSIIWKVEKEKFQEIVNNSKTLIDILRYFGLIQSGSSYKILKNRLEKDNIDYSHIPTGLGSNVGRKFIKKLIPLEKVMTENSNYCRGSLKKRLLKSGILKNECCLCNQQGEWKDKTLIMILDHINGVSNDNRIENLRMVCPNCNSQLDTTNGKNRRKIHNCFMCGVQITKNNKFCNVCRPIFIEKIIVYKINPKDRPSKNELEKLIIELPMTKIGFKYGVSDNTIRKWCKLYKIQLKSKIKQNYLCSICGIKLQKKLKTGKCLKCFNLENKKQIPSKDELSENLKLNKYKELSKKYNVSESLVRKWSRIYNLNRKELRALPSRPF